MLYNPITEIVSIHVGLLPLMAIRIAASIVFKTLTIFNVVLMYWIIITNNTIHK